MDDELEPKKDPIDLKTEVGLSRREMLRRSAIVGGALVWSVPAIQSMGMKAAAAQAGPGPEALVPLPGVEWPASGGHTGASRLRSMGCKPGAGTADVQIGSPKDRHEGRTAKRSPLDIRETRGVSWKRVRSPQPPRSDARFAPPDSAQTDDHRHCRRQTTARSPRAKKAAPATSRPSNSSSA